MRNSWVLLVVALMSGISCMSNKQRMWVATGSITIAKTLTAGTTNYIIGSISGAPQPTFKDFKERAYVTLSSLRDARNWLEANKVELARMSCATADSFEPAASAIVPLTLKEYLYLTESGGILQLRVRQHEPIAIAKEVASGKTNYFVGHTYHGADVGPSFDVFKAHAYENLPTLWHARRWIESNRVNMARLFCATPTTFEPPATNVVDFSPAEYRYLFRIMKTP
jgi:hypothetical protein